MVSPVGKNRRALVSNYPYHISIPVEWAGDVKLYNFFSFRNKEHRMIEKRVFA